MQERAVQCATASYVSTGILIRLFTTTNLSGAFIRSESGQNDAPGPAKFPYGWLSGAMPGEGDNAPGAIIHLVVG